MSAKTESEPKPIEVSEKTPICLDGQVFFPAVISVWRTWAKVAAIPDSILGRKDAAGVTLSAITLRQPSSGEGILLVSTGTSRDRKKVAFHRAATAADCLHQFAERFRLNKVAWRDEKPFSGEDNGQMEKLPPLPVD